MTVRKAASAGVWSTVDVGLRLGLQFVFSLFLARLLTPSDFGIISLLAFFSAISVTVVQHGLATALVQRRESSLEQESTIFWFSFLLSLVLAGGLLAMAQTIAAFYRLPMLAPLMGAAAAQVVFSALSTVHSALLTRDLRFDQMAKVGVISTLVSGAMGVAAAVAGAGAWSLAIQMVAAAALNSAALWWISPWRPAFAYRFQSIRSMFSFGAWLSLSAVLEVLYTQGFSLLLGKLHGVRALGLYNRAAGTQSLPGSVLSGVIGRVALPLFSARTDDPQGTIRGMRMAISVTMLLNVPAMIGLMILADLVMLVLYGPQWVAAGPTLSILGIAGLLIPLHVLNLNVLLAGGNSRTFFKLEIAKKLTGIACVVVGSLFGLAGLAWSQVVFAIIALVLNAGPAKRTLGYGVLRQLGDLGGIMFAGTVMGVVVVVLSRTLTMQPAIQLLLLGLIGGLVYFGIGFGLRLRSFLEAFELASLIVKREQANPLPLA